MSDTLKDAIKAAFASNPILGDLTGPFTDGWQNMNDGEWWRISQIHSPSYNRFFGLGTYVDRQVFQLSAFCETEDRADKMANAMNNLLNNPTVIQPLAGGGRTMSCQRMGNPTVTHFNPSRSFRARDNEKDTGNLSECWIASGTWMFILQKTLGVN